MKELLYAASVVLLSAGLAVAQSGSSQKTNQNQQNGSMSGASNSASTTDTQTPLATHPQTDSSDSMNKQNSDSKQGSSIGAMSGNAGMTDTTGTAKSPNGGEAKTSGATMHDESSTAVKKDSTTTTFSPVPDNSELGR